MNTTNPKTSTQEPIPSWAETLNDFFAVKLDAGTAERWHHEIDMAIDNITDDGISAAIRHASLSNRDRFSGKPTLRDLRIWIFVKRKYDRSNSGTAYDTEQDIIGIAKAAMLKADKWLDRWNILCDPNIYAGAARTTDLDECRQLESWARKKWVRWEEEKASTNIRGSICN